MYGFTFSGQLAGYGKVGGDSTFNYKDENYGGGFNLGTTDDKDVSTNGLGGGYSINKTSMSVGCVGEVTRRTCTRQVLDMKLMSYE